MTSRFFVIILAATLLLPSLLARDRGVAPNNDAALERARQQMAVRIERLEQKVRDRVQKHLDRAASKRLLSATS